MSIHRSFDAITYIFRGIAALSRLWFIALIAVLILSPITLHIRWSYQYIPRGSGKHFIRCHYLSVRGIITPEFPPDCPLFALIDIRQWRR